MQPIIQTFHPATLFDMRRRSGRPGYTRRKRCVHLQSGVLNPDSGAYCVWTALVMLGVLSETNVQELHSALRSRLGIAWRKSTSLMLNGANHLEMDVLLTYLRHCITYSKQRGSNNRVTAFAMDHLQLSQLVLLYYVDQPSQKSDWLLMVGIEEVLNPQKDEWQLSALLCLDPNQTGCALAPHNVRIERDLARKASLRLDYVALSKRTRIQLVCAFALLPTTTHKMQRMQTMQPTSEPIEQDAQPSSEE